MVQTYCLKGQMRLIRYLCYSVCIFIFSKIPLKPKEKQGSTVGSLYNISG